MELEHIVRPSTPDLYLMCCPVLGAGEKFVNKSVNKMGMAATGEQRPGVAGQIHERIATINRPVVLLIVGFGERQGQPATNSGA